MRTPLGAKGFRFAIRLCSGGGFLQLFAVRVREHAGNNGTNSTHAVARTFTERSKMKIETTIEIDPAYIVVEASVRYWVDATVNGVADSDGTMIPGRDGDAWRAKINLAEGRLENWPEGTTASIHYKVCDDGRYWLTDAEGKNLAKRDGYVPGDFLCHGDNGFGDYIIMDIGADGRIAKYVRPEIDNLTEEGWQPA